MLIKCKNYTFYAKIAFQIAENRLVLYGTWIAKAPQTSSMLTAPKYLLSVELLRLSPQTKTWLFPICPSSMRCIRK